DATLPVSFCLFSIEAEARVLAVLAKKRRGRRDHQRDPLISRSKQHVELEPQLRNNGLSVELAEALELSARSVASRVDEIGRFTPAFRNEVAESEDLALEQEVDELLLVDLHGHAPLAWNARRANALSRLEMTKP